MWKTIVLLYPGLVTVTKTAMKKTGAVVQILKRSDVIYQLKVVYIYSN